MLSLLRPTTLAAIVADLQDAEDEAYEREEHYSHTWRRTFYFSRADARHLDEVAEALVALVGPKDADKMITEAKEAL